MRLNLKRSAAALAVVAGSLAIAGPALAAKPAAGGFNFTYSQGGAAIPVGTAWTSTGGSLKFSTSSGAAIATCKGSAQSGVTGAVSGTSVSDELLVTGGSYSGCTTAGTPIYVTVNASSSAPWAIVPTGGKGTKFTGVVNGINVTVRCGATTATPATYSGNLTSGGQSINKTTGSQIVLKNAASLTKSGSGCPTLPASAYVTQTNTLATLGGSPESATNNIWVNAG